MFTLVMADAATAAGRVTFLVALLAVTAWVFAGLRRRRQRGERAVAWLVALIVLAVLCLGALAGITSGSSSQTARASAPVLIGSEAA